MNATDLTYLLQHPQSLNASQISDVRAIINEFPYFQPLRAIYLKGLKSEESFKYNQELKTTAAYTTDRSILFDFITSKQFLQNSISKHIKQNLEHAKTLEVNHIEDISINKSMIIDEALKQHMRDAEPSLDPELFEAKHTHHNKEVELLKIDLEDIKNTPETILQVGKPLNFNKKEAHSFGEWLKITSFKPIIRNKKAEEHISKETEKIKKNELIDQFIANNPKIPPVKQDRKTYNIAKAQMIKPKSLMTETLARIYVEQKKYDKAIQSYKILSLKYPEKSGFFADQILAIKELQNHNNIQ